KALPASFKNVLLRGAGPRPSFLSKATIGPFSTSLRGQAGQLLKEFMYCLIDGNDMGFAVATPATPLSENWPSDQQLCGGYGRILYVCRCRKLWLESETPALLGAAL